jgi:hypothetical protein
MCAVGLWQIPSLFQNGTAEEITSEEEEEEEMAEVSILSKNNIFITIFSLVHCSNSLISFQTMVGESTLCLGENIISKLWVYL